MVATGNLSLSPLRKNQNSDGLAALQGPYLLTSRFLGKTMEPLLWILDLRPILFFMFLWQRFISSPASTVSDTEYSDRMFCIIHIRASKISRITQIIETRKLRLLV